MVKWTDGSASRISPGLDSLGDPSDFSQAGDRDRGESGNKGKGSSFLSKS